MPGHIRNLGSPKHPQNIALCTALLRWPDRTQASRYVGGFQIVGDIELSHVFRDLGIPPPECPSEDELLGPQAAADVQRLLQSEPRWEDVEEIEETADREEERGHGGPPLSAAALDSLYGIGRWIFLCVSWLVSLLENVGRSITGR